MTTADSIADFQKAMNSDIARLFIPDVVHVNGSSVFTFIGGVGADGGLALPLRGNILAPIKCKQMKFLNIS